MAPYRKATCSRGHPRTPDNVTKSGNCKTCAADMQRERRKSQPSPACISVGSRAPRRQGELTEQYLATLVRAKTGLPVEEITPDDLEERRAAVLARRAALESSRNNHPGHFPVQPLPRRQW